MQKTKLLFRIYVTILLLTTLSISVFAQMGEIQGKVTDAKTGEGIAFANIAVEVDGTLRGVQTDFDGFYSFKPIPPGTYTMNISFVGYAPHIVEGILVNADKITFNDVQLKEEGDVLEEIVVRSYRVPLLKADETSTGGTVTSEEIARIATRGVTSISNVAAGVYVPDNTNQPNLRGGREGSEEYFIDGMRVRGNIGESVTEQQQYPHPIPDLIPLEPSTGESYAEIKDNPFVSTNTEAVSTFSIDVDKAAYSNMRRFVNNDEMPPKDAIRIEEMVNYFNYDYMPPTNDDPFAIHTEIAPAPWAEHHLLAHIGLQGQIISFEEAPINNLVFLIDVSGSMGSRSKLGLVKQSLEMLTKKMRPEDQVAIVVYAGAAGLVLPMTRFAQQETILAAIQRLKSGGSTAGGEGIELAYQVAKEHFIPNGSNRVILATDGDFNVGASSDDAMVALIEEKRQSGIFLSVLGFGMGNYKDSKMEKLANKGNGNYAYIDNLKEAKKVLIEEMNGTLITIAKDVKIQVAFDSTLVQSYRLIGYENRLLENQDFEDDTKDAGELGAGHTVTALYELVLTDAAKQLADQELMTVKFRYKKPKEDQSRLILHPAVPTTVGEVSNHFKFSAAVAAFGMLLRNSPYQGLTTYDKALAWAKAAKGVDELGYRKEFIQLIKQTKKLAKKQRKKVDTEEVKVSNGQ